MRKPYFNVVKNQADEKSVDIILYGIIGDWWDTSKDTPLMATDFIKVFKDLEQKYETINIRINSPGGSVWDGLPIFNIIAGSKVETHTYIDGIAYSMGAIIALAGKTIHIAKNGLLMFHNAVMVAYGNGKDFREYAGLLDKYDDSLASHLETRLGKTKDEIKSIYMNYQDHYYTAEEAKDEGLVDIVEDYKAEGVPDNISNMTVQEIFNHFEGIQETKKDNYFNKYYNQIISRVASVFSSDKKVEIMENKSKFIEVLGMDENATIEEILAKVGEIKAENETLKNEKGDLETQNSDLKTQNDTLTTERDDLKNKLDESTNQDLPDTKTKKEPTDGDDIDNEADWETINNLEHNQDFDKNN